MLLLVASFDDTSNGTSDSIKSTQLLVRVACLNHVVRHGVFQIIETLRNSLNVGLRAGYLSVHTAAAGGASDGHRLKTCHINDLLAYLVHIIMYSQNLLSCENTAGCF